MKRITSILAAVLFLTTIALKAQTEEIEPEVLSVEEQFDELIRSSNSYEHYKVIRKVDLNEFRSLMVDSMEATEKELKAAEAKINEQQTKIASLKEELSTSNQERDAANLEKNSISFFGIPMEKSGYKTLMWVVIAVLAIALLIFIYKFFESNRVTVQAKRELRETQEEMDEQRRTHIKKEQKIMRELQDEINKNL